MIKVLILIDNLNKGARNSSGVLKAMTRGALRLLVLADAKANICW